MLARRLFILAMVLLPVTISCAPPAAVDQPTAVDQPATPVETPAASEADEPPSSDGTQSDAKSDQAAAASTPDAASEPDQIAAQGEPKSKRGGEMKIEKTSFGKTKSGDEITLYTCTNANGLVLKLIDYGALVVTVETPDRDGKLANINLGFDKLEGYLQRHPYFGATVGRYCNRIAKGKFTLDGQEYTLAVNNPPNHLHGGIEGFDRQMWKAAEIKTDDVVGIKFSRRSPDGEEGYPGNLDVSVVYSLSNANELKVEFAASTDKATPVNLTNHNYWNLGGAGAGTILDHELTIHSDKYLPVDDGLIPTGEQAPVENTPLDFRSPHKIGERIKEIKADPVGYDHCFVLRSKDTGLTLAARAKDPKSGRVMEIHTTQPGIQFYSGNFLDGQAASGGYKQYEGFCLETQHFPDSPNQSSFPTTILQPGETYTQTTVHKFSTE